MNVAPISRPSCIWGVFIRGWGVFIVRGWAYMQYCMKPVRTHGTHFAERMPLAWRNPSAWPSKPRAFRPRTRSGTGLPAPGVWLFP